MNCFQKTYLRIVVGLMLMLLPSVGKSQFLYGTAGFPLNLYQQFNGSYGYKIIGKSHNPFDRYFVYDPAPSSLLTSSSATLTLAPNQTVVSAYLVWSGIGNGANNTLTLNGTTIIPDTIQPLSISIGTPIYHYKAMKDVTSYVQSYGSGIYQVANLPYNYNYFYYASTYYQGWNLVVVYSDPSLPSKQLNIYEGFLTCPGTAIAFTVPNLTVANTTDAKMSYIIYNGTAYYGGPFQCVQFNGSNLSNGQNPSNNPFNSTHISSPGTPTYQIDVDTYDISNNINAGDTSAVFYAYNPFNNIHMSTLITHIYADLPDATISLDSITGQDICQNQDLTLDYTVYNLNATDTLLAGTPISVFVNDSILISTVLLPSNILIDDSLNLSTLVTIPNGVSSPFSLSMVVNQNATQFGVFLESNLTNNTSNDSTISLTETIFPFFGNVVSFCQGTSYTLPNTSLNNVVGTWSPAAFNNQQTTTYTFTPDDTLCYEIIQLTVNIVPLSAPFFNFPTEICVGESLNFPLSTTNGAFGTWAPAFNNQATTTYSWTPTAPTPAVGCPTIAQHTVTIIAQTPTTFAIIDSVCFGSSFILPSQSSNGINGAWSPAFNSQATTTYTFTPTTYNVMSGCPATATHAVFVAPSFTPSFSLPSALCIGDTYTLPALSNEGLSGAWSQPFNNQQTTSYTFTPSSNGLTYINQGVVCPVDGTYSIGINMPVTPLFTIQDTFCFGTSFSLPTISNNNISGTWAPAFNNQQTTTYTFTSNINTCTPPVQKTIFIAPLFNPSFNLPSAICQSEAIILPQVANNGVSGTWTPALNNQQTTVYTFVPDATVCATNFNYTLFVNPTHESFDTITLCQNQLPLVWNGQTLTGATSTSVTYPNQYGCDSVLNLHLIVNPNPALDFSIPAWSGCLPLSIAFTNNQVEANTIYNWSFGNAVTSSNANTLFNLYTQPGCYDVSLTATNQFGCAANLTQTDAICFDPNPVADFEIQNNPLPVIAPTTLLQNNSLSTANSVWDFGDGSALSTEFSPIHTFPEKAGSYTVTLQISNSNGCTDSNSQIVQVEQDPIYYVPNAFTPNGSALNNVFLPIFSPSLTLQSYNLKIFNRWGEIIFESQDPLKGWDGTVNTTNGASMSPDGMYTYKLVFIEEGFEKVFEVVGSVSLVR
jgi:gliding motility-associated-like protein